MSNLIQISQTGNIVTFAVLCFSLLASTMAFAGKGRGAGQGNMVLFHDEAAAQRLTEDEKKGLLHMYQEEKLARDVYTYLGNLYQLTVFENIAASEQRHMDAVVRLLAFYDIDNAVDDTVGSFTDEEFASLYDTLVDRGETSSLDGLVVGATIEDLDIYDLQELIADTDNTAITRVYENLAKGSRNHMRAFIRLIEASGETYSPQFISTEEFEAIVSSPQERGPAGASRGSGAGRIGMRNGKQ